MTDQSSPPAPPAESEFFGTQPDPLPETLPDGTLVRESSGGEFRIFGVKLKGNRYHADRYEHVSVPGSRGKDCTFAAQHIDWKTVKRPPAPPAIEQTAFKVGQWVRETTSRTVAKIVKMQGRIPTLEGIDGRYIGNWPANALVLWRPQPGEMCEGDRFGFHGDTIRGPYERNDVDGSPIILIDTRRLPQRVEPSTLRPASTPPVRDETTAAGSAEAATRTGDGKGAAEGPAIADPPGASSAQPAAVDPYVEHRAKLTRGGLKGESSISWSTIGVNNHDRNERLAALRASTDPLDRLAARRQRSSRAEIESVRAKGAERGRHDWDPEDAQELFASSGWSGR